MSRVRVLAGTRKGAFILSADGKRQQWEISGPPLCGLGDLPPQGFPGESGPALCVAVQRMVRADDPALDDGGKTWEPVGNEFKYDGETGTHQWYDGTQHPWEFKRVWHLEPSLTDPEAVYAGAEDAALFHSADGAKTWQELPGLSAMNRGRAGSRGPAGWACTRS